MSTPFDQAYIKPSEIARHLDVHRTQVYKMIKEGVLPHVRIGKAVRVPVPAYKAYLRRLRIEHEDEVFVEPGELEPEIESRLEGFKERTGVDPDAFIEGWKSSEIPDTAENAELAMDALALRSVLRRHPVPA